MVIQISLRISMTVNLRSHQVARTPRRTYMKGVQKVAMAKREPDEAGKFGLYLTLIRDSSS